MTLNRNEIKLIAFSAMVIDHFAAFFITDDFANMILRDCIGRISYPLFLWLFIIGFDHISQQKYLQHIYYLILSGIATEPFFDVMVNGEPWKLCLEFNHQNIMFAWLITFICLIILEMIDSDRDKNHKISQTLFCITTLFVFICLSIFFNVDYSFITPLVGGFSYIVNRLISDITSEEMRNNIIGCIIVIMTATFTRSPGVIFALPFIFSYNNTVGGQSLKLLYYVGYPLHLAMFSFIRIFF